MCKKQFLVSLTLLIVLVGPAALIKAQEPPTVISKKHVVVAGESGRFLCWPANSGNPPSMIRLKDGCLVIAYGHRDKPYGIRATVSADEGQTWSDPIILRDDARTWDVGYCRMVQRPDGKLVTVYYCTTDEHPEQFIGTTIWQLEPVHTCDVNRDGVVNFLDLATVLEAWLEQKL